MHRPASPKSNRKASQRSTQDSSSAAATSGRPVAPVVARIAVVGVGVGVGVIAVRATAIRIRRIAGPTVAPASIRGRLLEINNN